MQRAPIVFKLQQAPQLVEMNRDYSSCAGYGQIKTILSEYDNPSVDPLKCYNKMKEALKDFQRGDYLLWSGGDPMSSFLAGLIVGEMQLEDVRWLRWDKRTNDKGERMRQGYYVPVAI